jgi:hypothetical protein
MTFPANRNTLPRHDPEVSVSYCVYCVIVVAANCKPICSKKDMQNLHQNTQVFVTSPEDTIFAVFQNIIFSQHDFVEMCLLCLTSLTITMAGHRKGGKGDWQDRLKETQKGFERRHPWHPQARYSTSRSRVSRSLLDILGCTSARLNT